MNRLLAIVICLLPVSAMADKDELWLNMGGVSYHPGTKGMNESNPGFGLELGINSRDFLAAGMYKNSIGRTSHYLAHTRDLYQSQYVSAGIIAGVVTGYEFGTVPMVMPYITAEYKNVAATLMGIPRIDGYTVNTLAVQFKLRLN